MKTKINMFLVSLLVISAIAIAGLTIDNRNMASELVLKNQTIGDLNIKIAEQSQKLYDVMNTKITTANKVIQVQNKVSKLDSEDQCKQQADRYFTDSESLPNFPKRSTYRSHWNTNEKACIIEITYRQADANGSIATIGIMSYDLTNDKQRLICSTKGPTENATSCEDSIFKTFEDIIMSQ